MKRILLTLCFMLVVILCLSALTSYADERRHSHLHLRGRITTPDGQPIEGAKLTSRILTAVCVNGVPTTSGADIDYDTKIGASPATNASGQFHIIIVFKNPGDLQADDVNRVTINPALMTWDKAGYRIQPK